MLTGKNICKFLLDVKYGMNTAIAIIGVMFAGSINLLKRIQPSNKPALLKNQIVICDRFTDSTLAYQVYGKKVDINFINNIHKKILSGVKPNIVFILKVSEKISKIRLKKRKTKNRYDNFPQSFYNKAQKSFINLAKGKKNYFVLDSSQNDNKLEKKILKIVYKRLNIR